MTFPNTARGPSLLSFAALTLVAGLTGCNDIPPVTSAPVATGALPAPDEHNRDVVLGTFEGSFDGENFTIHEVTAANPASPATDVAGHRASLDTLLTLDGGRFGSSTAVSGTGFVALKQNGIAMRMPMGSGPAWDVTNCGAAPTSGSCVAIQMQNQIQDWELQHPYVEFTAITATNFDGGTAPTVTFRSNAAADSGYGVSATVGLARYPDRLARNGGSASPIASPSPGLYWVFSSTAPTISFVFTAVVRAHIVSNISRQSLSAGTDISAGGGTANGGTPAAAASGSRQDISDDGRFTVFQSTDANLDSTHTGATGTSFVYMRDNVANTTRMLNLVNGTTVPGVACNSTFPTISTDGSTVAFLSTCQLLAADTNLVADVYTWQGGTMTLASVDNNGTPLTTASAAPSISGDGNSVAFLNSSTIAVDQNGNNCTPARAHVWVYDNSGLNTAAPATSNRVDMDGSGSCGNNTSFAPALNSDGTLVVFDSNATNLVASDTNARGDVFLASNDPHNGIGVTQIVSLDETGAQLTGGFSSNAAIMSSSSTGLTTVAFQSTATSFTTMTNNTFSQVYVVADVTNPASIRRVSVDSTGTTLTQNSFVPSLDQIGRFVAFGSNGKLDAADGNTTADAYVLDMLTADSGFNTPRRISLSETGAQGGAIDTTGIAISDNSNYVVYSGPDLISGGGAKQVHRAQTF